MILDPRIQFERDYEEYADAIFRFLYYKVQDRERALELTQEVFVRFWQYLASGKKIEYTKAFLYRSASNAFINEIRTDKKTTSLDALMELGFEAPQSGKNLNDLMEQKELVERLRTVDVNYRDVLVMRYVEDMSVQEIARLLNEKENTISVRIKRGIEKLKKIYE